MEAKKKDSREARREARRNAILKDPNERMKSLKKIGNDKKSSQPTTLHSQQSDTGQKDEKMTVIRRTIQSDNTPLFPSINEDNPQPINVSHTRSHMADLLPPNEKSPPTNTQPQLTIHPPSSLTTSFIHKLVVNDNLTILLRLLMPMMISFLITIMDYSISIVMVAVMNTLLFMSYIMITHPFQRNRSDETDGTRWLDFLPMILGWYYPKVVSKLTLVSLVLCILYTFITDLALTVFSFCFTQLMKCLVT